MQARPPCLNHQIFTNPQPFHPDTFDAMDMCELCPMRRKCALDALTAGDSLDKAHKRPAMDVIQAGVMCDGDQRTADELAAIAGVPAPVVDTEERFIPPSHCLGCKKPMIARIKGIPLDVGTLTHAAHGYCRICDAKRRRAKGWESAQPKHTSIFSWKETHAISRTNRAGRGRARPVDNRPPGHPKRTKPQGVQGSLF